MDKIELKNNVKSIAKVSKSVAADLLSEFSQFLEDLPKAKSVSVGCNPIMIDYIAELESKRERRRIREAIKRLHEKELITVEKKGRRILIHLTNKGGLARLRSAIENCDERLPEKDYCLVSFDIPEHLHQVRDEFRRFLKKSGFIKLHQSLWGSPYSVVRYMSDFVKKMKVGNWVSVFQARMHT